MSLALVIDDEQDLVEIVSEFLTLNKVKSVVAKSIQEAKELAQHQPIEFIFCDFQLGDGKVSPNIARELVQLSSAKGIVLMSGNSKEDVFTVQEWAANPDFHFLPKPFDFEKFQQIVKSVWR